MSKDESSFVIIDRSIISYMVQIVHTLISLFKDLLTKGNEE